MEEKLQIAVDEQKKLSEYQTELSDAKIKLAQLEISQETYRQKCEKVVGENKLLLGRVSKLDSELSDMKRAAKMEGSDDVKLRVVQLQTENETLRSRCDDILGEKDRCEKRISELETELFDVRKKGNSLEERLRRSDEVVLNLKSDYEKKLSRYRNSFEQLSRLRKEGSSRDGNESIVSEKRIIQLFEQNLRDKDEKLDRLAIEFEKIKDERDRLLVKLQNQAEQFEQYVKSQQLSAELNLSPRNTVDFSGTDFQKIKQIMAKEIRDEMEKKVAKRLRRIEEQERKKLEEERMKVNEIGRINEKLGKTLESHIQELQARKLQIEKLEEDLKKRENDSDVDKNLMSQIMTEWVRELEEIKAKTEKKDKEIEKLRSSKQKWDKEITTLKSMEKQMKSDLDLLKHKYEEAKRTAANYKVSIY